MAERGQNPFGPGLGHDPARLTNKPTQGQGMITNRRVELPKEAYALDDAGFPSDLPLRPGVNTAGKVIKVRVNQYKVAQWPVKDVYQYDILIGSGAEKRGKVMAIWMSKTCQDRLRQHTNGMPWLWDGNKIAWTSFKVAEQRFTVDLDADKGRAPRPGKAPDTIYVVVRPTKTIRMDVLGFYLTKKIPFDSSVLEAINFLDHAMRMWPSGQYTQIKRSFFARGKARTALDNVVEAMKGVYTSIRLCDPKSSEGPGTGLAVNVDVANGTFWAAQDVHQAARNLCSARNRSLNYNTFAQLLLPIKDNRGLITQSDEFKLLRKMAKLKFTVKHRGKEDDNKTYTIKKFTWDQDKAFLKTGVNAKNWNFNLKNKQPDGTFKEETISVYNYFHRRYNIQLQFWMLPLIVTTRDGYFPMEVATIVPNQKYQYKLSPEQTQSMIKFAVTRPKDRLIAIDHGVGMLKWSADPYLEHYGIKIDPNMTVTHARLLPPPEVQYAGKRANPGTSGRWDLRGMKFFAANPEPLKSWGICIIGGCVDKPTVQNFINVFVQTYIGHGGVVANKNPVIYESKGEDLDAAVVNCRNQAGNQAKLLPQILLFVLPGRDSFMYERLKKNMECRFATVSQMLNVAHVKKAQPQYCSNVCMKLNAKLGGASCKVADAKPPKPFFPRPTMIIGADVSHPTPGSPQASMAALTMSFDKEACRYAAAVQTNGHRVEMITEFNIKTMMVPLFRQWITKVGHGQGPQHIYYFRDGVSEGQYSHVLTQEVDNMKKALGEAFGPQAATIKWTVTICTKRHHIRFFPKEGDFNSADRNGNALPGTLVERDVTHPFEYDFYLCAHSAIQGTARPVHYHVILDEAGTQVNDFQRMIYQMSYQYMRSTTPVSLFPAVYYAHLASNRARAHESAPASDGARGGQKYEEAQQDQAVARAAGAPSARGGSSQTGTSLPIEARPLLPLGNPEAGAEIITKIRTSMWYI